MLVVSDLEVGGASNVFSASVWVALYCSAVYHISLLTFVVERALAFLSAVTCFVLLLALITLVGNGFVLILYDRLDVWCATVVNIMREIVTQ